MTPLPQPALQPASAPAPPPLPQAQHYHVVLNGQQAGSFDMGTLRSYVQSGQMTGETLVWCQGMTGWTVASEVNELKALFGSTPPPLPM